MGAYNYTQKNVSKKQHSSAVENNVLSCHGVQTSFSPLRISVYSYRSLAFTFFKHGYDGYHEASMVVSCPFGNDIAENKASNFASCPWNHNRLIIPIACGKGYFSSRVTYHSCSVSGFHLIRLFISGDACLNPGPDKCENCGQAATRNHGCLSAPSRISSIHGMAGHNKPWSGGVNFLIIL